MAVIKYLAHWNSWNKTETNAKTVFCIHSGLVGSCAVHYADVSYILQLCRTFCRCAVHSADVPYILQLCRTFCSCVVHSADVPYIMQMCRTFCSCAVHFAAVPYILQMCRTFCSCVVHSAAVSYILSMFLTVDWLHVRNIVRLLINKMWYPSAMLCSTSHF